MKLQQIDFKKGISLGSIGGMLWGWIVMLTNAITGFFPFEHNWFFNFIVFSVGGAIFGIVAGGFMVVMKKQLLFKSPLLNLVSISVSLWIILSLGGFVLSLVKSDRYHYVTLQTLQGFVLSLVLGFILGFLWNKIFEPA